MRQRGVAVVVRHGKVLLVRDTGKRHFSLPGGALKKGEPTVSGAARELYEELGMTATRVTRLRDCDFKGAMSIHKVCLVDAKGEPHVRSREIDRFLWWDMKAPIPVYAHVKHIVRKIRL